MHWHGGSVPEGDDRPCADLNDETHYRILRLLEVQPEISQRELARQLGISLGKANYCLQALLSKGWIKAENFRNSRNKIAYSYLLTPEGIERKAKIAMRFLKRKLAEFEAIKHEIDLLLQEVAQQAPEQEEQAPAQDPKPDLKPKP